MPEPTIHAVADHGAVHGDTVTGELRRRPRGVRRAGGGRDRPTTMWCRSWRREGVEKFEATWLELLDGVQGQLDAAVEGPERGDRELSSRRTQPPTRRWIQQLVDDKVASRSPPAKDPTLWGPDAEAEAAIRLGWLDTSRRSREPAPQLRRAARRAGDLDHVVLAGMGGSSLAPEVIARTPRSPLVTLDTTDPGQVRAALSRPAGAHRGRGGLSKSGSTVETDSHRRAYWQAFVDAGMTDAGRAASWSSPTRARRWRRTAVEMGFRVVLADPNVGGRYTALTAFGLVPSALAGVEVAELLDQADAVADDLRRDRRQPRPGAGRGARRWRRRGRRDKLVLADGGTGIAGLGDWAEQLIAESTGKAAGASCPVVVESRGRPGSPSRRRRGCSVVVGPPSAVRTPTRR